ncbi:MAG TPA: GNAT family N-acetyltransferase [Thermomicrobiaceae bacterium]|nr:GNAT family N-acetyltransferase [Thermomicrobiaceae bacterium]
MSTPTITIRAGRMEDAPAEAELNRDVDWCWDEEQTVAEYHDDAYEPSSVLVAESDGQVVGKLELFVGAKSVHGRFGLIRRFVVHRDYRGQGVGRVLLDAATERARDLGCSFIELSVDVTNPAAHAFYQRDGFVEDRVEVMMRKSLDGKPHASFYAAQKEEWR